jgi:hypothetical protein
LSKVLESLEELLILLLDEGDQSWKDLLISTQEEGIDIDSFIG